MNNFAEDLKFSHKCEDDPCWRSIYEQAFPTMVAMISHRENGDHQKAGIDRSVILANSKQIMIDEKARRRFDTGDIMLEFISNDQRGDKGWVEKSLLCDYIAYAFIPSGICYLMPVPQLQAAWIKHKVEWLAAYGTMKAKNATYYTHNCPVKTGVLFSSIGQMLRIHFQPTPTKANQEQLL